MMMNLFSNFDPSTNFNLSMNWMSSIIGLLFIPSMYWFIPSRFNMFWLKLMNYLNNEFKTTLKINYKSSLIFMSLFSLILFNNLLGLFPYIFTSSSHLSFSISLALPLWLSFMLFGWINNTIYMFSHLLPIGTPNILMPFMVCIETISNLIRPGTLAIRLTANMIAGHLLLTLLSNMNNKISIYLLSIIILIQIMLMMLELAVSIIQSYVFTILSTLYASEMN